MANCSSGLALAEPTTKYTATSQESQWLEVLVDCPGVQELFTYKIPEELKVEPGDIVSVPFGQQFMGGIAIRKVENLPLDLDPSKIKAVTEVIASGFFPSFYWQLLHRVAEYYYTPLITVIRAALPPGLLGRSQRRLRLKSEAIPASALTLCTPPAKEILQLLQSQKTGDYSALYLQRQSRQAYKGIQELIKKGWVESYLEPPKAAKPKLQKAVSLVGLTTKDDLSSKQREILEVLARVGGELWLQELLQMCHASASSISTLERNGYVIIEQREKLRLLETPSVEQDQALELNTAQTKALETINQVEGFGEILLHGVTGSGKTEVYLRAITPLLSQGKSALVLVPEIGLTPQLTDRFKARFGQKVAVYHSGLSDGERYDTWRQMLTGEGMVLIGTRSAIFAPLANLGLIILDEEHDSSFKQQQPAPTYHARTVALWRGELENCRVILGSATPSLESWQGVQEKSRPHTQYISLPERIGARPLPPVEIVDMRQELQKGNRSIFSQSLKQALTELSERKEQGILFISRRGHSTFVSCRSCGYVMECPNCDVSLSYHHAHEGAAQLLRCHYCNYTTIQPSECPTCSSPYLKFFGSGTQKVTQELTQQFPQLRLIRFDSDTTQTKDSHRNLLTSFAQGEADVLVGTQMLTKGLDIAQVTLVGVVSADGLLNFSDYRASERAFQTLTQVAGRAGRGSQPGKVIIQTYSPEHPVIQAVQHHDYQGFIQRELPQRSLLNYPPYGKLITLRLSGLEDALVEQTAENLASYCNETLPEDCEILGPAPASIKRVANRYRWQILLKFAGVIPEKLDLKTLNTFCPASVSFNVDIDPLFLD